MFYDFLPDLINIKYRDKDKDRVQLIFLLYLTDVFTYVSDIANI